jgi:hypothetical protein
MSSELAIQALNKELCFQWYIPPLDKPLKEALPTEPMVCNVMIELNLPLRYIVEAHHKHKRWQLSVPKLLKIDQWFRF